MPSEARAVVVISARDESSKILAGIGKEGAKAGADLKKSFGDAVQNLTGFNLGTLAAAGAVGALAMGIKSSIDTTTRWADEVDKFARNSGLAAEEASKLMVVANDFGVKTTTLEAALKALNKTGQTLSTETLARMAKEYQALPPGVERLTYATKNFGRSAQEMTELLDQTPEKLLAMGLAAERSGKIMSGPAVDAAQNFKIELAQLGDQLDGVKIKAGGPIIGALSAFINAMHDGVDAGAQLVDTYKLFQLELKASTGAITYESAALQAQTIVQGATNAALQEGNESRFTSIAQLQEYVPLIHATTGAYDGMIDKAIALEEAQSKVSAAASLEAAMVGELTGKMIFQTAAAGENSAAQLAIARAMGLVDEATLHGVEKVQALKVEFDKGTITLANYVYQLGLVKNGIDGLTDKTVNVNVHTNYTQYGSEDFGGAGGGGTTTDTTDTTDYGDRYAAGGNFIVPPGYPNDSYRMRVQSGEHVQVTPAGKGDGEMSTRAEMYFERLINQLADRLNRGHRDNILMHGSSRAQSGAW